MIIKEKLRTNKMHKGKNVTSYLTGIQGVRDELATFGENPTENEMVRTTLNGFAKNEEHSFR